MSKALMIISSLTSGMLFGLGLALSGMTQPAKVVAFLDVTGNWDPSLGLVMAGAIVVYMPALWLIKSRGATALGEPLRLPTRRDLDRRLLLGSAIFGVGWGVGGVCPGPAITTLGAGTYNGTLFVMAMIAGMLVHKLVAQAGERTGQPPRTAATQRTADQEAF